MLEGLTDVELRQARFATDLTGWDNFFDGFTKGEDWNGFACPYFTLEQGQRIVDATNKAAAEWLDKEPRLNVLYGRYDHERDAFVFYYRLDAGYASKEGDSDIFPAEIIDGRKLYPIGTGGWAWTQEEAS